MGIDRVSAVTRIHQDSGETDWWTPAEIIVAASELMGGIDLDPATSHAANARAGVRIPNILTAEDDGLRHTWRGNVWLNHPFSRQGNPLWIGKLVGGHRQGLFVQSCNICYASTGAGWFAPLLPFPQFFFTGRVQYIDPATGKPSRDVPKDSVLTFIPPGWMNRMLALEHLRRVFGRFEGVAK